MPAKPNYFVFTFREGCAVPFFERACGTEEAAQEWVRVYEHRYEHVAFYTSEIFWKPLVAGDGPAPHRFFY